MCREPLWKSRERAEQASRAVLMRLSLGVLLACLLIALLFGQAA